MDITLNTGATMPALGFAVFRSPPEQTTAAVQYALSAGCRHSDAAAAYAKEQTLHGWDKSAASSALTRWSG